ncbi:MAG: glycosyltransferase family 2 protein, partial [Anaerolineae bacterium]|nr:glycosyltransferase family 2 protein [Anaerolineae bacterium]
MRRNPDGKPYVIVVALTWNQKQDTLHCLASLQKMTYANFDLLLVDNGSVDGTATAVREQYPDVSVIENAENLGFPGGFNVGLRYAISQEADYIFMINNDTFVDPSLLDYLVQYANEPEIGMVSPKIYYAEKPNRIWSVGGIRHPLTYEMTAKGDNSEDLGQWDTVIDRDYLVGCALLMSRKMLEDVGLLDEGYFPIYYEDMDLCLRVRQAGYRLLLVPQAQMWHKVSAAAGG